MLLAEFGTGQVLWSMVWFTMFFLWIWLVVAIFGDIFRDQDLSGWGKAGWSLFVIVTPWLGVLVYLIARGRKMTENAADEARARDEHFRSYVRDVVATTPTSGIDELERLASLHTSGAIDDVEFEQLKAKVVAAA